MNNFQENSKAKLEEKKENKMDLFRSFKKVRSSGSRKKGGVEAKEDSDKEWQAEERSSSNENGGE